MNIGKINIRKIKFRKTKKNIIFISGVIIILVLAAVLILVSSGKTGEFNLGKDFHKNTAKFIQSQTYLASSIPYLEKNDWVIGSRQAPVKIFVYEDYTNIFSARLADTLAKIRAEFGNKVAIVARPYFKGSALAYSSALAIDCTGDQAKKVKMRDLLFSNVKQGKSSLPSIKADAKKIGLDSKSFDSCLTEAKKSGKIESWLQVLSKNYSSKNIQGVPTMFIGSKMILGARPYDNYVDSNGDRVEGLQEIVQQYLLKTKK